MRTRSLSKRSGFTLVELAIGTTILTFAILVAAHSQVVSMSLGRDALSRDVAASDLMAAMEQVLLAPAAEIPLLFPPGAPLEDFTDLHLREEQIVPSYPGYVPGEEVPNPLELALTIEWVGPDRRARSLTIETVKTK